MGRRRGSDGDGPAPPQPTSRRTVNAYGQGAALREEILRAAAELLGSASSDQAVTLRAIARRTGVAAPSIYRHFTDRDAVVEAVVERAFADLADTVRAARHGAHTPGGAVRSVCSAYVAFAAAHPGRYRVLFGRSPADIAAGAPSYPEGLATFEVLVGALESAVGAGASTSTDPRADSAALFACLHGVVTTPDATPGFPWPDSRQLLDRVVTALAHLQDGPAPAGAGR